MLVSDSVAVPMQDATEDRTSLGSSTRGGWRPILDSYFVVMDWFCPKCRHPIDSNITGFNRCWRCGLPVMEYPIFRDPLPPRERNRSWKNWSIRMFEGENGRRTARPEAEHQGASARKSSSSTKRNSHRARHSPTKSQGNHR